MFVGRNSYVAMSILYFAFGCSDDKLLECHEAMRLAVVQIWDSNSQSDPDESFFRRATRDLRELVNDCPMPDGGVAITGNAVVQPIQLYLLAGVPDKFYASLAEIDSFDRSKRASILITSARYGDVQTLQAAVNAGISPDLRDEVGNSAISAVVDSPGSARDKIDLLLNLGVDPLASNDRGYTALDAAVLAGDADVAKHLLKTINSDDDRSVAAVAKALDIAVAKESPLRGDLAIWLDGH